MKWYEFDQNNSGGSFDVDDKVCHRLFIEAESEDDAIEKALDLGVYFDGCEKGMDCSCCGDRWSEPWKDLDFSQPYEAAVFGYPQEKPMEAQMKWQALFGHLPVIEPPKWSLRRPTDKLGYFKGKVMHTIESYAQYLADDFGWTTPDCRIFYHDGTVKDIFSNKIPQ